MPFGKTGPRAMDYVINRASISPRLPVWATQLR